MHGIKQITRCINIVFSQKPLFQVILISFYFENKKHDKLFFITWTILRQFARHIINLRILRFIAVSLILAGTVYYYIKCNEIPSSEDGILIEKIAGVETGNTRAAININRNYSASYKKRICSFIPKLDSMFTGNYNAIQIISNAEKGRLYDPSTFKKVVLDWNIKDYIDTAKKRIDNISITDKESIDSVNVIYSVWQYFQLNAKQIINSPTPTIHTGLERHPKRQESYFFYLLSGDVSNYGETSFAVVSNILGFNNSMSSTIYSSSTDSRFNYLSPHDISQMYVKFKIETSIDSLQLSFNYWGNTEFSKMTPEPDITDLNKIVFNNQSKIKQIKEQGLIFFVKLSDTTNIQNTRMFIIATAITILLTVWIGLLYDFIPKRFKIKH